MPLRARGPGGRFTASVGPVGDNRKSATIWLGLTAAAVQLLAAWVGYPEAS